MPGKTPFVVHRNESRAYVMACICTVCGVLVVAFGDDAYGMFSGTCVNGHGCTTMAS